MYGRHLLIAGPITAIACCAALALMAFGDSSEVAWQSVPHLAASAEQTPSSCDQHCTSPSSDRRECSGRNLDGWGLALGDVRYHHSSEREPALADGTMEHMADRTVIRANVKRRRIISHIIAYCQIDGSRGMQATHELRYEFRVPYILRTASADYSAETAEGGFAIWDGERSRLDYQSLWQ